MRFHKVNRGNVFLDYQGRCLTEVYLVLFTGFVE